MMSGTSVDSIDAALCEVGEDAQGRLSAKVEAFVEYPMPEKLRQRIFRLFDDGPGSLSLACSLNFEIAEAFAEAACALIEQSGVSPETIDAIASHGQTAYHVAPHMAGPTPNGHLCASTLQIGEGSVIAERTGIRVVCDFRVADMAAGGNGAPLVPFADYHLFSQLGKTVIAHNIGGIANSTVLPASGRLEEVLAFDTGPGNMIIDALVQHFFPGERFDADGRHARRGEVLNELLAKWMTIPYIDAAPPKSTGRELFGVQFARKAVEQYPLARAEDLLATATLFTARSFARNLELHVFPRGPVSQILLAGGGALNRFLVELIEYEIASVSGSSAPKVLLLDEIGFSSKARECVAFALLGYARLKGLPANVPSATGASHRALLGKVIEPFGAAGC